MVTYLILVSKQKEKPLISSNNKLLVPVFSLNAKHIPEAMQVVLSITPNAMGLKILVNNTEI